MNDKPNYKKGKRKEITELMLHCSVIPFRSVHLYCNKVPAMIKQLNVMWKEGTLTKVGSRQNSVFAFKKYNAHKDSFEGIDPEYLERFEESSMHDTYHLAKDDPQERSRLVRHAETFLFMYGASVPCKVGEKPYLSDTSKTPDGYYDYREVRKECTDLEGRARGNGILISAGGNYPVFNVYNEILHFTYAEENYGSSIEGKITGPRHLPECKGAILLTADYLTQQRYLAIKNRQKQLYVDKLFYSYPHIYALNHSAEGQDYINIMRMPGWDERIYQTTLGDKYGQTDGIITCDGMDNEGCHYFSYCVPDISRFHTFLRAARTINNKALFAVVCFDTQVEFIKAVTEGTCRIFQISFEDYKREIGLERRPHEN